MNGIDIEMKSVYSMESKIARKIKEIGLVFTDVSTVVEDCHALAIAMCVGNNALVHGAFEYLRSGVGFKNFGNTSEKWRQFYGWVKDQFHEE